MTMQLLCAYVLAFLFTTAFGKGYIPWLVKEKARQEIKTEVKWHESKSGTPTMGGVMFILAEALVCLTLGFPGMLQGHFEHIFVLLFAMVFGAIGLLDDWKKIRKKQNANFYPISNAGKTSSCSRTMHSAQKKSAPFSKNAAFRQMSTASKNSAILKKGLTKETPTDRLNTFPTFTACSSS